MQHAIYRPSNTEIQQLQQILALPGYQVLEKINLSELDLLQIQFMNVDPTKPDYQANLAAIHGVAKGGAQFYRNVSERIAGYVALTKEQAEQHEVLPDVTEEIFG